MKRTIYCITAGVTKKNQYGNDLLFYGILKDAELPIVVSDQSTPAGGHHL